MPFWPGPRLAPVSNSSKQRSTHSRSFMFRCGSGAEPLLVEDQLGVGVGAHQDLGIEAGEVDVRERDGVAGDRVESGLPGRQLLELGDEAVVAVGGLLERRPGELVVPGPPAPEAVAADGPGLDLDGEEAALRVGDQDVRLALAQDAAVAHEPGQVREHRELGGQRVAEAVEDVALRAPADAVVLLLPEGRRHQCAEEGGCALGHGLPRRSRPPSVRAS